MSEKDLEENSVKAEPIPEIKKDEPIGPTSSNDSTLQNQKPTDTITVKKSTYNNMLKGIVITIAAASFFAGYGIGTFDTTDTDDAELNEILAELNAKIDSAPQSAPQLAPQPTQQPTQSLGPQIIQGLLDDDPVMGNPDATVTIVEFSDFQCPFCQRFHQTTLPLIQENYIDTGKVKFVYRDFPIVSIHPNGAISAALSSECADEQGMFWEYHDKIFQNQKNWERLAADDVVNELKSYAVELGLNTNQFNNCLDSEKYLDEVNKDLQDGESYGITGTPGFLIGNEDNGYIKLVGAQPYAAFEAAINAQLG